MRSRRELSTCQHIELVRAEVPGLSALTQCFFSPRLDLPKNCSSCRSVHRFAGVEMRKLGETDGHYGRREYGVSHAPEIGQRFFENIFVVQSGNDNHLAVELNAA